jgi:hypothetical protein
VSPHRLVQGEAFTFSQLATPRASFNIARMMQRQIWISRRNVGFSPFGSGAPFPELNPAAIVALKTGTVLENLIMAMSRLVLGVLLLGLTGQTQAGIGWDTFTSLYSGCSIAYPSYIFTPAQQTTADGATRFTGRLANAEMVIAGGSNEKNVQSLTSCGYTSNRPRPRTSLTTGRNRDGQSTPVTEEG